MGNAYSKLDKDHKAEKAYLQALKINEKRYQAYLNLFDIYKDKKEYLPKEIDKTFHKHFKSDKNIYVLYLAFQYFVDIHHHKEIDLSIFKREYRNAGMECCVLDKEELLEDIDEVYKEKMMKLVHVLEKYTRVFGM